MRGFVSFTVCTCEIDPFYTDKRGQFRSYILYTATKIITRSVISFSHQAVQTLEQILSSEEVPKEKYENMLSKLNSIRKLPNNPILISDDESVSITPNPVYPSFRYCSYDYPVDQQEFSMVLLFFS